MIWMIGLLLAATILALAALAAFLRRKANSGGGLLTPINILFTGTFLSAAVLFIPIYANLLTGEFWSGLKTVFISAHSAIRLFVVDADFIAFTTMASTAPGRIGGWYGVLASVLCVLAPVLTFGVILSFFACASAMVRYILHWRTDLYLFSELNERSFTLASGIRRNYPKPSWSLQTYLRTAERKEANTPGGQRRWAPYAAKKTFSYGTCICTAKRPMPLSLSWARTAIKT